jgi:hypothetical protein
MLALQRSFSGFTVPLTPHSQLSSKAVLESSFSGMTFNCYIHSIN